MIAKGVTMDQVEEAAARVGVRPYNLREVRGGVGFTLKTGEKSRQRVGWNGKLRWTAPYQRLAWRARRSIAKGREGETYWPVVPGAVCWHGHRDFLRVLFKLAPDAKVKTALITYLSGEHFERHYEETRGTRNNYHGFGMEVQAYDAACTCEEEG